MECQLKSEEVQKIYEESDICGCCGGGTETGYKFCTPCQEICGAR